MNYGNLRSLLVCICIMSLALPYPAFGQQAPGKSEPPAVRVTTRLVQVNVIVRDKDGKPIENLTQKDFTLLDQGKEQTIAIFSVQRNEVLARRAASLPANIFSNRPEHRGEVPGSVSVILLDALNTTVNDQAYAKDQVIRFLKQLQPGDRVAIFLLAKELTILHDFTTDATPLLRVLARLESQQPVESVNTREPDSVPVAHAGIQGIGREDQVASQRFNDFLRASQERITSFQDLNRAKRTLESLEAIAHVMARISGRKNLIWVSGSFPFSLGLDLAQARLYSSQEQKVLSREIERASRAITDANVAVYPVDAQGLVVAFSKKANFDGVPGSPTQERGGLAPNELMVGRLGAAGENPNAFRLDEAAARITSMKLLAERTGGLAFYNTNDLQTAVRRAIEDSRFTYVLGYYPTHGDWNGKFREIKVRLKRSGLDVRHRTGYVALPDQPLDRNQRIGVLRDAAMSPLEDARLGIVAQITYSPGDPNAGILKLQLDPNELQLLEQQGNRVGGLDLLLVQRNPQGKSLDTFATTQSLSLDLPLYQTVLKHGLLLDLNLNLKPEASVLRVVVRDATSGLVGSVDVPLQRASPK